jgi:hypothetical protein
VASTPEHPAVRGRATVVRGPRVRDADGASPTPMPDDALGHGTAVAATMLRFLPADRPIELLSPCGCSIANRSATSPPCWHALRHALTLQPAVINLSLGTTSLRHRRAN